MSVYKSNRKRKDGVRWGYNIYVKDPKTGKGKRLTKETFKTKKEAMNAERRMLHDIEEGIFDPFQLENKARVEDIFDDFITYYSKTGVSESSARVIELGMRKHFVGKFGDWYIKEIKPSDLYSFYEELSNKLVNYRSYKFYMSQFLEYARSKGIIHINPMNDFPKLKKVVSDDGKTKTKIEVYNEEELNTVLSLMKEHLPSKQYTYFLLLGKVGLRKAEALALYKEDIDLDNMRITINKTITTDRKGNPIVAKGTKSRNRSHPAPEVLPLDPTLKDDLIEYKEKTFRYNETKFLFNSNHPSSVNGHLSVSTPDKWLNNFFNRHKEELIERGINHRIHVHGFRHCFVTILTSKGFSQQLIMNLTRHSDYNTTLGYTQLDVTDLENMMKNKKELDY